jgi:4'-phosphopantetheinyl transferase
LIYITMWDDEKEGQIKQYGHNQAHKLLRYAIKQEYGITEELLFSYGEHGKPYLKEHDTIYFNLSHCKGIAACAFGIGELGVDVERVRPVQEGLIRKALTPKEQMQIAGASDKEDMFFRFWTLKESFIKTTGKGLSFPLTGISFTLPEQIEGEIPSNNPEYCFFQRKLQPGSYLSACIRKEDLDSKFFYTIITDFTQIPSIL